MRPQALSQLRVVGIAATALLFLVVASSFAQRSFGNGFLPHGYCFTWVPALLWLNVGSDALIALSYLSIPLTLVHLVRRRQDIPFGWMYLLFGTFIVACGATHALDVWTTWNPDYWLLGSVKALTAAASVPTAIVLVMLVPKLLAIPSAQQLRDANEALRREIGARTVAEQGLQESRKELSRMVDERTLALHKTSALLDAFFDSSPLCLAVFDAKLRFVRVNRTFAALSGVPIEQHWGRTIDEIDPAVDPCVPMALQQVRDRKEPAVQLEIAGHGSASAAQERWRITVHLVPKTQGDPLIGYACEVIAPATLVAVASPS